MEEQREKRQDEKQDDISVNMCDDDPKHSDHDENSEQTVSSDTFIASSKSISHTENNIPEINDEGENNGHQKLDDSLKATNSSGSEDKQENVAKINNKGDVNQTATSVAPPHSSVINVADDTLAWRCSKIQELNPAEHGDYFESNAEKIYREKVKSNDATLHFNDGIHRIDMILTYPEKYRRSRGPNEVDKRTSREEVELVVERTEKIPPEDEKHIEEREFFEKRLEVAGLKLEREEGVVTVNETVNYLKISAPWEVLNKYAEYLKFRMPIKVEHDEEHDSRAECCSGWLCWPRKFDYDRTLIPDEPNFFTAAYKRSKAEKFKSEDRDRFFTAAQRTLIVDEILKRTPYGHGKMAHSKIGIESLLKKGTYTACYPLHDGHNDKEDPVGGKSQRMILCMEWANWRKICHNQPISRIAQYYGQKIGLYFLYLGFYTKMLVFPSIAGVLTILFGAITAGNSDYNQPSIDVCNENGVGNTTMCPNCEVFCPYWKLKESCSLSYVAYATDNSCTIAFSVMMSLWAVMFGEMWKRKQAVIAWEWDLESFEEEEQPMPEYVAKVEKEKRDDDENSDGYLPSSEKVIRTIGSYSIVIFMLFVVLAAVLSVILYRLAILPTVANAVEESGLGGQYSNTFTSLLITTTSTMISLVIILVLNKIYGYVAKWLTNMEYHRTYTEYEDSLTFKLFFFQFINYYSNLFYIAFFKGKLYRNPLDNSNEGQNFFHKFRSDECDPAGCFYELSFSLFITMVGKQLLNNVIEIGMPFLMKWWKRRSSNEEDDRKQSELRHRWQYDYTMLEFSQLGLLEEYLELAIQYGFITLFVAAFPLAPLFALINNAFEIRLDAIKFLWTYRRPLARRAEDIGAWAGILQMMTFVAVVTNGWTIAISSDFIPHMVYKYFVSSDESLDGYIMSSLSVFNTSDWERDKSIWPLDDNGNPEWPGPRDPGHAVNGLNQTECYFKGITENVYPYDPRPEWWHVFAARMAFVLAFQHVIFSIAAILMNAIPDVPKDVKLEIHRENEMERQMLFEDEDEPVKNNTDPSHSQDKRQVDGSNNNMRNRGGKKATTNF